MALLSPSLGVSPVWANTPSLLQLIHRVAVQEGVDPALLTALVATESDFKAHAVSPKGAVGLTQLMPGTARDLGVGNRFNPEENLRGGARYFRQMLDRFSRLELALAAYNAGPGSVERYGGVPPFAETRDYIRKVMTYFGNRQMRQVRIEVEEKRLYRYRQANGTLVITDAPPPRSMGAVRADDWKSPGGAPPRMIIGSVKRRSRDVATGESLSREIAIGSWQGRAMADARIGKRSDRLKSP
ncbi:MAG: lytic transglycosylase domain-containing protein [Magnetococcales bacterium]|nr:lytic transglycosylase domain-containing protein [Magnetococcales bacterium]MBF0156641.1 lytic transglycosylase domain-containing protein [Magnetococcales bacterium]